METFAADTVELLADVDYGEGMISFRWPDSIYGYEELNIDLDGHCWRRMPIYSGIGIEAIELSRHHVKFRFGESLARNLQFQGDLEITFTIPDDEFEKLRRALNFIMGLDENSNSFNETITNHDHRDC